MVTEKFNNRYRILSARLASWDYSRNAIYFVTICTKNREHHFGRINNSKMELSETGLIAEKYWIEIPQHFPFVQLDAFIIMPDHVHGIIIIDKSIDPPDLGGSIVETPKLGGSIVETPKLGVSTMNINKWQSGTLGVIINQYKRICTINARLIEPGFSWQSRFYDIIIRDERSFSKIKQYIHNNPLKWKDSPSNRVNR
ncbi:MAG TPA: transposase [Bacteroidales bacterium]|nr:transposase [Bacteroidales bacterium]